MTGKKEVLLFGDSLFEKVKPMDNFEYKYHVESYPGWLARDFTTQYKDVFEQTLQAYKPNILVLCLGTNDLGHGLLPSDVCKSLLELHKMAKNLKVKQIVAVYLRNQPDFNILYSNLSADDIEFCEFFLQASEDSFQEDNLHLNTLGSTDFAIFLQEDIELL